MGETKDNSDRFKCETGICALSKPEEVLINILPSASPSDWIHKAGKFVSVFSSTKAEGSSNWLLREACQVQ